jgi:hypothetical protein
MGFGVARHLSAQLGDLAAVYNCAYLGHFCRDLQNSLPAGIAIKRLNFVTFRPVEECRELREVN